MRILLEDLGALGSVESSTAMADVEAMIATTSVIFFFQRWRNTRLLQGAKLVKRTDEKCDGVWRGKF